MSRRVVMPAFADIGVPQGKAAGIFVRMGGTDYLDLAAIADRLGVEAATARIYHQRSRRNRRSGDVRPGDLPEPDAVFGRSPVWKVSTIQKWEKKRPGRGVGGAAARKRSGPVPRSKPPAG